MSSHPECPDCGERWCYGKPDGSGYDRKREDAPISEARRTTPTNLQEVQEWLTETPGVWYWWIREGSPLVVIHVSGAWAYLPGAHGAVALSLLKEYGFIRLDVPEGSAASWQEIREESFRRTT